MFQQERIVRLREKYELTQDALPQEVAALVQFPQLPRQGPRIAILPQGLPEVPVQVKQQLNHMQIGLPQLRQTSTHRLYIPLSLIYLTL